MSQRYSFIIFMLTALTATAWWSERFEVGEARIFASVIPVSTELPGVTQRRSLLEVLDRVVQYEHYYRSVYGHFTKMLPRLGVAVPSAISEIYDVRIVEASAERLLVSAVSEVSGNTSDWVSINQDFEVRSSFGMPSPSADFLQARALRTLRAGDSTEKGVYSGYFEFTPGRAVGLRAPVMGVELKLEETEISADAFSSSLTSTEEARFAQKIYRVETGRYAKSLEELSQVASLRLLQLPSRFPSSSSGSASEHDGLQIVPLDAP
jgi:hypothetical protein